MGIPCRENAELREKILAVAEALKVEAHRVSGHGLSEEDFYNSGVFRGAIERIRGQFAASMQEKRDFLRAVLNRLEDDGRIRSWESSGGSNRHDYTVVLPSGRTAVIELKGCLDGNNTNIFERPPHAEEFVLWSVCTNPGADPRHNLWSGVHTRLSAEIIAKEQQVDGLVVWDMVCGTIGRPCPKIIADPDRVVALGPYALPPPCIYLFPGTIPSPRNNPQPRVHELREVQFLEILAGAFGAKPAEIFEVGIEARYRGTDLERRTTISRNGSAERASDWTPIRRA